MFGRFEHDQGGCEIRPATDSWRDDHPHTLDNWDWYTGLTVVTNEAWGGTYEGGKLRVLVAKHHDGTFGVVVSGNDDFFMRKLDLPHMQSVEQVLKRIPMVVTIGGLVGLGFGHE